MKLFYFSFYFLKNTSENVLTNATNNAIATHGKAAPKKSATQSPPTKVPPSNATTNI